VLLAYKNILPKQDVHHPSFSSQAKKEGPKRKKERNNSLENKDGLTKARGNTLRKDGTRVHKTEGQILPQIKSSSIYKGLKNLWSNSLQGGKDCNIPTRYYLFKIKKIRKEHQTLNLLLFPNTKISKYH